VCLYISLKLLGNGSGKHIPAAMNTHAEREELLDVVSCMQLICSESKIDDLLFPEIIVIRLTSVCLKELSHQFYTEQSSVIEQYQKHKKCKNSSYFRNVVLSSSW
jgi:hypothetical protein